MPQLPDLAQLAATPANGDEIWVNDLSDTTQSVAGTSKRMAMLWLALTDGNRTVINGGGTINLAGYTLTVGASGTVSLASDLTTHEADTTTHGTTGDIVGTSDTQTLTNKTITQPSLTLEQSASPSPTAEGEIWWDTDDNTIKVGDGATTQTFTSGATGAFFIPLMSGGDTTSSTSYSAPPADQAITFTFKSGMVPAGSEVIFGAYLRQSGGHTTYANVTETEGGSSAVTGSELSSTETGYTWYETSDLSANMTNGYGYTVHFRMSNAGGTAYIKGACLIIQPA